MSMINKEKTAVDWLYNELTTKSGLSKEEWAKMILTAFSKAKAIEKKQIKEAYWNGSDNDKTKNEILLEAEEFYNEWYGNSN